jgi:putative addiction module component (TIGR02574 family)
MTVLPTRSDILKLSVAGRIESAGDIWDSVAEMPESVERVDAEKAELDRRLEACRRDPEQGSPWSVVRERIRNRR